MKGLSSAAVEVLTVEAASKALGTRVASVRVAQTHAEIDGTDKSGRHSDLSRVAVECPDDPEAPRSVIVKRVLCAELPDRPPAKWARDIKSYSNDVVFYRK